ncbi:MAG TPA: SDR family NAD(P)-dependent oxidoreductase [Anaerolineales bacterium]|nr:SDR family NAD(P)-dependent oxidoreductase [Anaerolineales bacterium]
MEYEILITGANRGLGLALTEKLLAAGHHLHAINRRVSSELSLLQETHPRSLHLYPGDVSDESSIRQALQRVAGQVDRLDIVLNNAAINLERSGPLLEQVDFSIYVPTYQINAVGPLMVVKYALPLLRLGKHKLIVNISSEAGSIGASWRTREYSYCMSKAALNMSSRILQNALKGEAIKVLALHPGWFSSDMGGAGAPITPAQAAREVMKLVLDPPGLDGPIFVAANGDPLEW